MSQLNGKEVEGCIRYHNLDRRHPQKVFSVSMKMKTSDLGDSLG
jgi:hypothetical protein